MSPTRSAAAAPPASRGARACVALLLACSSAALSPALAAICVAPGTWVRPQDGAAEALDPREWYARLAGARVVLLGEHHDSVEQHRWQLQVIAGLHALRPQLVIGLEMLPRRVQPVLDRWVAGGFDSEAEFLRAVDWDEVWRFDAARYQYLPILHFARMNRVPLLALNVERTLLKRVGSEGWAAIPPAAREGVGDPARPAPAYLERLREAWRQHARSGSNEPDEPAFLRFVDGQLLWDRAMAEALAARASRDSDAPLLVALLGAGHVRDGLGVPYQLDALGVDGVVKLLTIGPEPCTGLQAGTADALFGLAGDGTAGPAPLMLGVVLATAAGTGVRIERVLDGSLADTAGLQAGDLIRSVAGHPVHNPAEVAARVRPTAPGTWLPVEIERGGRRRAVLVRVPPEPGE